MPRTGGSAWPRSWPATPTGPPPPPAPAGACSPTGAACPGPPSPGSSRGYAPGTCSGSSPPAASDPSPAPWPSPAPPRPPLPHPAPPALRRPLAAATREPAPGPPAATGRATRPPCTSSWNPSPPRGPCRNPTPACSPWTPATPPACSGSTPTGAPWTSPASDPSPQTSSTTPPSPDSAGTSRPERPTSTQLWKELTPPGCPAQREPKARASQPAHAATEHRPGRCAAETTPLRGRTYQHRPNRHPGLSHPWDTPLPHHQTGRPRRLSWLRRVPAGGSGPATPPPGPAAPHRAAPRHRPRPHRHRQRPPSPPPPPALARDRLDHQRRLPRRRTTPPPACDPTPPPSSPPDPAPSAPPPAPGRVRDSTAVGRFADGRTHASPGASERTGWQRTRRRPRTNEGLTDDRYPDPNPHGCRRDGAGSRRRADRVLHRRDGRCRRSRRHHSVDSCFDRRHVRPGQHDPAGDDRTGSRSRADPPPDRDAHPDRDADPDGRPHPDEVAQRVAERITDRVAEKLPDRVAEKLPDGLTEHVAHGVAESVAHGRSGGPLPRRHR